MSSHMAFAQGQDVDLPAQNQNPGAAVALEFAVEGIKYGA